MDQLLAGLWIGMFIGAAAVIMIGIGVEAWKKRSPEDADYHGEQM